MEFFPLVSWDDLTIENFRICEDRFKFWWNKEIALLVVPELKFKALEILRGTDITIVVTRMVSSPTFWALVPKEYIVKEKEYVAGINSRTVNPTSTET